MAEYIQSLPLFGMPMVGTVIEVSFGSTFARVLVDYDGYRIAYNGLFPASVKLKVGDTVSSKQRIGFMVQTSPATV